MVMKSKFRKKCIKTEHKFAASYPMAPYVFCQRWFCQAEAVSIFAFRGTEHSLHNAIPEERRFPPVEMNAKGEVVREWG